MRILGLGLVELEMMTMIVTRWDRIGIRNKQWG
jgi:hypothetical protein